MSEKLKCAVCGYICLYEEKQEKCPVCGVGQTKFIPLPREPQTVFVKSADLEIKCTEEKLVKPLAIKGDAIGASGEWIEIRCGKFNVKRTVLNPGESISESDDSSFLLFVGSGNIQIESEEGIDILFMPKQEKHEQELNLTKELKDVDEKTPEEEVNTEEVKPGNGTTEEDEKPFNSLVMNNGAMVLVPEKMAMTIVNTGDSIASILKIYSI